VLKVITARPLSSGFGNTTFYGLNAFRFTNAAGKTTPVRWILKPMQSGEAASAAHPTRNYLFDELIMQMHRQPLRWRLIVIVGKPGDPTNDPSIGWLADREQVDVGVLTLDRVEAEEFSAATDINFDPLTLPRYGAFGRSGAQRSFGCLCTIVHPARGRDEAAERDHTRGREEGE